MRYILLVSFVLLFFGCNSKHEVGYFDKDKVGQQALINTRKQEILKDGKRYLLAVTYLNAIEKSNIKQDDEKFVVNIYDNKDDKTDSYISAVSLNGDIKGVSWVKLDSNSSYAKFSPTYNKWGTYFLIKAPLKKSMTLKLVIEIDNSKRVRLDFLKDILK